MASAHLHASGQDRSVKMTAPPKRIHRGNWLRLPARITGRGGAATGDLFSRCRGLSVNRSRRQSLAEISLALSLLSGQVLEADGFPGGQCRMLSLRLFAPKTTAPNGTVRVEKRRRGVSIRGNTNAVAVHGSSHRSSRAFSGDWMTSRNKRNRVPAAGTLSRGRLRFRREPERWVAAWEVGRVYGAGAQSGVRKRCGGSTTSRVTAVPLFERGGGTSVPPEAGYHAQSWKWRRDKNASERSPSRHSRPA